MVRLASTRAINEEHDQEKEDAPYTREAQMSELVRKYESSLKILNSDTPLAAREMLYELLEHPIVHKAKTPPATKGKGSSNPPQAERLLYLVLKHLADVEVAYLEQAMVQGGQCDPQKPLALYADALNLDSSDVQLWLRFGRAAMTARAPAVARVAFERGLELHPHHPLLCEELLQVLIQIGDVDSATALARTIAAIDPNNTLAQQLMSITAAPSAAHL